MASGTRQGGRPRDFWFWFGEARGRRAVCAATVCLAALLAGEIFGTPGIHYSTWCLTPIPSTKTASKSCGTARGAAVSASMPAAARGRRKRNRRSRWRRSRRPPPRRNSRSSRTPATRGRAGWPGDFAAVVGSSGSPGRAIVGSTSPNGLGKVLKDGMADFAIVSLDSLLSSAKDDPEWMKRSPSSRVSPPKPWR